MYVFNTKILCIKPGVYVRWLMGRGTPKSRWCGIFAKHYANDTVNGSSGGCVATSRTRAAIEEDGSPVCCSHRRVCCKKSSAALYHFGSVAIIAHATTTNALRGSTTVGSKNAQNAARRHIPRILGLISKTSFGNGDMMFLRRSLYLYTSPSTRL